MKFYWVKTHAIVKRIFSRYVWSVPTKDKTVYLTFDDGPTPEITEWVLAQLETHNAKATFFCIGQNIQNNPDIFKKVVGSGHSIGNHTFNHVNGWHVNTDIYMENVAKCTSEIEGRQLKSNLFRPPYGKLSRRQSRLVRKLGYKIVMWDILTADFDTLISPEKCLENAVKNIQPGSIIIFHDSVKAFPNLKYALPKTLQFLSENGFQAKALEMFDKK